MAGTTLGTAYVQIVPSAQGIKGSIQNVLDPESKNAGQSAGTNIVSFVKKALIGGAIGKVLKDTILQGSDLEQLRGGVEKIFDEANTSKIFEDANNAYKDLNLSANDYLSTITSVGATFASTMGDQKGYDFARAGMLAVSDYATGTGKNVDLLNEKFQMISRSTSSYQSIADQFAGLLPQTSSDFLAQAQAAGFLSDSYTSLTDVPVAEYQQALVQMLQKGTEEMGLAENTAAEAEKTLSGSFAAMKGAVSNFMAQLTTGGDLSGALDAIFNTVINFGKNLLTSFGNILLNLPDALGSLGEMIMQKIQSIGDDPSIGIAAGEFIKKFALGIITNLPNILGAILTLVGYIGNTLAQALGNVFASGASWIAEKFGAIWQAIQARATSAIAALRARFATVISAITKPFQTAFNTVRGIIDRIRGFFPIRVGNLLRGLKLPHFSLSGKFSLKDMTVPHLSVSWYAKGGIIDGATVFGGIGMGEAGPEAIMPLDPFWKKMDEIANNVQGGSTINIYVNGSGKDPRAIAEEVKRVLIRETNQRRLAWQ